VFRRFSLANPNPETELYYVNNYTLLVAVMLSAQATDIAVNKVTKDLFPILDSPEKMLVFGENRLLRAIKSIGLYKTKAKHIIATSKLLIKDYDSSVPSNIEDLCSLPGVGRKTANVILNCAFGLATLAVDTHVSRVSRRLPLTNANNVMAIERELVSIINLKWLPRAHHWLILHGRYVCQARKPKCSECLLCDLCKFSNKTL
jgi:endonuclease-3